MPAPGARRPKAYCCYLCGAQFGSQSLFIHIANCQEKWEKKEADKPKRERRPVPPPPAELESGEVPSAPDAIDDFNARMFDYYNRISLCQCPHCGRSFNEEAFARHQTMCTAETPGGPHAKRAPGASSTLGTGPSRMATTTGPGAGGGPAQKPRAYTCYLCGQQYGSKSLPIHVPQCQEKWTKVEAMKPKGERRAVPPIPFDLDAPLPTEPEAIDAFNAEMFNFYNGVSLYQCKGCGRSFHSEAYAKHKLRCPGLEAAATAAAKAPIAKPASPVKATPRGYMCYKCGDQFDAGEFKSHVPACPSGSDTAAAPFDLAAPLPSDAAGIEAFNARMAAVHSGGGLVDCEHCGRSFHAAAFRNHRKLCTAERPFKPAPASATATSGIASAAGAGAGAPPPGGEELVGCEHCNRKFNESAFQRHQRICTADKPMKPIRAAPAAAPVDTEATAENAAPPKSTADMYASAAAAAADGGADAQELQECEGCGRTFAPAALARHANVCAKVFQQKRKPLNTGAQRLAGLEGAAPASKSKAKPTVDGGGGAAANARGASTSSGADAEKWKRQSDDLRAAMKASREISRRVAAGESLADMPYVPSAPDPSLIQCPHCQRRFNEKAAERHIPSCANTVNKPKFLKAGTGGAGKGAPKLYAHVPGRK